MERMVLAMRTFARMTRRLAARRAGRAAKAAAVGDWATVLDLYTDETLVERVTPSLPGDPFVAGLVAHLDALVSGWMPAAATEPRARMLALVGLL